MFAVNMFRGMIQEMTPASFVLPVGLSKCYSLIHYVRCSWRYSRWWKKNVETDSILKIAVDHGLSHFLEKTKAVQLGAQCIYILKCLNDCVNENIKLYRVYKKLCGVARGHFFKVNEEPWEKNIPSESLWYSIARAVISAVKKTFIYIKMLAYRIYKVVKTLFRLSLLTLDASEAFSTDPVNCRATVHKVISDRAKIIEELSGNAELLVEKLKKNHALIQKILTHGNIGGTAQQLIGFIEGTLDKARKAGAAYQVVESSIGGFLVEVAKDISFGFFSAFGFSESLPNWLVPSSYELHSVPVYTRFIPRNLITYQRERENLDQLNWYQRNAREARENFERSLKGKDDTQIDNAIFWDNVSVAKLKRSKIFRMLSIEGKKL